MARPGIGWRAVLVALLALVLLAAPALVGFAANGGLPGENKSSQFMGKRIPARMKPGTIVTFDAQGNVVVLNEGEDLKLSPEAEKQKAVEECQPLDEEELPAVEPGMVVIYDALGAPVVIHQGCEEPLKIDLKEIGSVEELQRFEDECKPATPQAIQTQGNQSGVISWYNGEGKKGAAGVVLDSSSAAHRTIQFWTRVRVTSYENGKSTVVKILDRGPYVSGRILDMVKTAFSKIHPPSKGLFRGYIVWPV